MSSNGVSIAFKLTVVVLLLGILGIAIGVLIVDLNIRDDVEATPEVPTTVAPTPDPTFRNIPDGDIVPKADKRYNTFAGISNGMQQWMNISADPCDDFYHYACGTGQKNPKVQSPFTVSANKNAAVEAKMWTAPAAYWDKAPLPVKQAKWIRDKCGSDKSYTVADQAAKQKEMLNQFIGSTKVNVPFLYPKKETTLDKTSLSQLIGFGKGQFSSNALLTAFVSTDFKEPDTAPYTFYIDQPLPIFVADVYTDDSYPDMKSNLTDTIADTFHSVAAILNIVLDDAAIRKMAGDVVEFDKVISDTMQQDPIVRRQVMRNYNPYTLAQLNTQADQFDWVQFIQSAMTMLGEKAKADGTWRVIVMETDITINKLNAFIKKSDDITIANYIFFKTFKKILKAVPAPRHSGKTVVSDPMDALFAEVSTDKRTLTGQLRKPDVGPMEQITTVLCGKKMDAMLPWATTRMYVDTDMPDEKDRKALKENVNEIANWIFFGFRSQLDQLNWMDEQSKKEAFDKLNNIRLNVAFPDWVADDKALTEFYAGLDVTAEDNFMNQWIKLNNYMRYKEVEPIVTEPARDRGDFSSFVGITNAWYQPQMNSITFPEGILQEPFYSPDYPVASIFGGLGAISGHELTHGFDDQGVQWDGIGALRPWMTNSSQDSFNDMAQCVIDEYSSFCRGGVCVNGENTQGENIADNGGIQAAYKAFKAYESLKGADPRLPEFGSAFTSDQLFFLTFGQVWCDNEQSQASFETQVKTDVHSPAYYRVLGTLQNFPAFRNAFHCPVGDLYTPEKHCDVWTSMPF